MARSLVSHAPQTLKQAKALHRKRNASELSKDEQRRLDRQLELDRRAEDAKQRAIRKKTAHQKRMDKEQRERGLRQRNGLGMATQLAGFNHTQLRMKNGMERFLGVGKGKLVQDDSALKISDTEIDGDQDPSSSHTKDLQTSGTHLAFAEPWDDIDDELFDEPLHTEIDHNPEAACSNLQPVLIKASSASPWNEDDIDDDTLMSVLTGNNGHQNSGLVATSFCAKSQSNLNSQLGQGLSQKTSNSATTKVHINIDIENQSSSAWDEFWESNTQICQQLDASPCASRGHESQTLILTFGRKSPFKSSDKKHAKIGRTPTITKCSPHCQSPNSSVALHELGLSTEDIDAMIADDLELSLG